MIRKPLRSSVCPSVGVLSAATLLALMVSAILIYDASVSFSARTESASRFQRLAGGLGMGATVCPRWCFVNFDPRIERCTCADQPLPGGYCYCPEHGGTISFFLADRPQLSLQRINGTSIGERLP